MGWYANLKIRYKLISGYAVVVALSCIIGYYGIRGMGDLKALLDDTHDHLIRSLMVATQVDHHSQQHFRQTFNYLLTLNPQTRQQTQSAFKREETQMKEVLGELEKVSVLPKERQLFSGIRSAWNAYLDAAGRAVALSDLKGENLESVRVELVPLINELEDLIGQMRDFNVDEADRHYAASAASYQMLRAWMTALSLLVVLVSFGIATAITRSVTVPLGSGVEAVQVLARRGEEKSRLTAAIAEGDLSQEIRESELLTIPAGSLSNDETGKLLSALVSMGETQGKLDRSFTLMTESLRRSRDEERARDWLKSGLYELNALMRGEQKTAELAERVLAFLARYLKAGTGAFYLFDDRSGTLQLAATYAFVRRKNLSERFRLGEGVIGQAALEKKMICLSKVPVDYLPIGSALGEAVPQNVVALPLLHDGQLVAALELATFELFSDREIEFLTQAVEGIAIGLGVSLSRQRINELLEKTQQQTEELRVQQEELQQTNEELEERAEMLEQQRRQIQAKNREIETASAEIVRKAADLEKVSAYKSEFLANMSHELRTPLNSMMILSGLLVENKEGTLSEKQREFAATINSAGRDLLNLINDILDLSKVEAGRLELQYDDYPIRELRDALEEVFVQQAEQKGLSFFVAVEEGVPETVRIDEQRTRQIVKNLVSNALKFTEEGSVSVTVSVAGAGANPLAVPALAIAVRDTGIGIDQEKHELIFQAFQQVDGSTSRKFGGTGLGLSISLQLARRMGGEIALKSRRGEGSTFTLFLPLSTVPAGPPAPGAHPFAQAALLPAPAPVSGETGSPLPPPLPDDRDRLAKGDKSILIIEDDLNFAGTLMTVVRERGFGCLVASDGTSGVHLADRFSPSAVILDVMLPGMDGWSVMRWLKENPATRHIPVHFITCLEERQKGMAMGAVGFCTKPVTPEQLEEVFANIERCAARAVKTVLLVEDDRAEAQSVTDLLRDRSLDIVVAGTGREAIGILDSAEIDCIVLDLGLPDISGFDVLEHIHANQRLRSIPVIIHTGRDLSREEELKLNHFARSIIVKGVKGPERLLNEVTLFLHMVESELPGEKRRMIRSALDKESMLEGKKVLLVDDDMRNVFSLSSILSEKSVTVVEAENGREALERLGEHPDLNLVLMDIMMPEMDGYEAMRNIRLDPRFRSLPIIAMTAKAMPGDQEKCIQAGASDYISKPIDLEKLLSLLRVWLYRQAL